MPTIKKCCTYAINPAPNHRLVNAFRPGEHHSSYSLALEALDDYCHWVSEAVLPIAFAWIDEHYDEVYAKVPAHYRDDVAVVIAAAFEIVKTTPYYQKGIDLGRQIESNPQVLFSSCLGDDPKNVPPINPVWTDITNRNASKVKDDWEEHRDLLDSTIHWKKPHSDDDKVEG